jgi:thioredoxin 1
MRADDPNRNEVIHMTNAITLTEQNFEEEVLRSEIPVLVDYWAAWCGPCRLIDPVIDEIAAERPGALKVGKVNIDEQPELAERAGARSIPFVVLYRDGEPAAAALGAQPKPALERALELDRTPAALNGRAR